MNLLAWIFYTHMNRVLMLSKGTFLSKLLPTFLALVFSPHMHWLMMASQTSFLSGLVVTLFARYCMAIWIDLWWVVRLTLLVVSKTHCLHWYFISLRTSSCLITKLLFAISCWSTSVIFKLQRKSLENSYRLNIVILPRYQNEKLAII